MPVEIEIGNREGQYFTEWRFDKLREFITDLTEGVFGIPKKCDVQKFKMWYDNHEDFHCLEFDLDGDHYLIRFYKVFNVMKNGDRRTAITFYVHSFDVAQFFHRGKHKGEWH